jgi:hypothetical protein
LYESRNDPVTIDWHEETDIERCHVAVRVLKHPVGFSEGSQAPFTGTP